MEARKIWVWLSQVIVSSVLVPPTSKGNYQDGLLCYPNHGLINLRSFNNTPKSVVIAWSFYTWDLDFVRYLRITVKQHQKTIMVFHIDCRLITIDQHQLRTIRGLNECRTYAVALYYEYTLEESRTENLTITTTCSHTRVAETFTSTELFIIVACSLFLLVIGVFLGYFIHLARQQHQGAGIDLDVIDEKHICSVDNQILTLVWRWSTNTHCNVTKKVPRVD